MPLDELDTEILKRMLEPIKRLGFKKDQVIEVISKIWDTIKVTK